MRALITDGDQRSALAVTKSLGAKGIEVVVGEGGEQSLASSSKYCSDHVTYPSPHWYPEKFSHFMLEVVQQKHIDLVIPISDVTTYLISRQKDLTQYTKIPIPAFEAFDFVSNKWKLLRHAKELGIPTPMTYFLESPTDLQGMAAGLTFPVVVKPCRSKLLTEKGWLSTSVHYANSTAELGQLYINKEYLHYPSLIQERIVGPGMGLFVLFDRGEFIAAFSHRRLREKPPSGGVSVLRESIPVHPALADYARRLLQPLGWHGVAMMEYKVDQRTGEPLLMEVNGRFWGSLQLAIDAGMDFPYLLCQLATQGYVEPPQAYQHYVKSRWLLGDLDHLLARIFKSDSALQLPEKFPSRARTLIQFLKFYEPGLHYEIFSLSDPGPFLYEISHYVQDLIRSRTRSYA